MKRAGFDQLCGVAAALDVIGDRGALLVVRELLFSAKRFGDLLRGLPGMGTNTLTTRLAALEEGGIVQKRALPPPAQATVYELTPRGRALTPVLVALARWGSALLLTSSPKHRPQPAWLGLALLAYFAPAGAPAEPTRLGLVFPDGALTLDLGPGTLRITEGDPTGAALTLTASEDTILDLVRGALTLKEAKAKGRLSLDGDAGLVSVLLASFPLGPPR
jgi:DNA-binding HxlR family transcriptional regulator